MIAKLRGLRYPDEYLIRMFYKLGLAGRTGHVLELGCGSANNLLHFAAHQWQTTGIDISPECVADGTHNLKTCGLSGTLVQHDLDRGLPPLSGPFHALLAPSTLYYLRRESVWTCLHQVRPLLAPGAALYLRMRLPDDHRAGRGTAAPGANAWCLDCDYTGEAGLLNVFWDEYELLALLDQTLGLQPHQLTRLRVAYDNLQCGRVTRNSDIILWGQLP